jgi:hypothetical protein
MYFFFNKMPFFIDWSRKKSVELRGRLPNMELQENPLNGRRDTAYQVICSCRKVPFIIDRSLPNLRLCTSWGTSARCGVFRKNPLNGKRCTPDRYSVPQASFLHYKTFAIKFTGVLGHSGRAPGVGLQENPSNLRWDSADKVLTSSTKKCASL